MAHPKEREESWLHEDGSSQERDEPGSSLLDTMVANIDGQALAVAMYKINLSVQEENQRKEARRRELSLARMRRDVEELEEKFREKRRREMTPKVTSH